MAEKLGKANIVRVVITTFSLSNAHWVAFVHLFVASNDVNWAAIVAYENTNFLYYPISIYIETNF